MGLKMRALTVEEYLELGKSEAHEAVSKILNGFDFERAHLAILGCQWTFEGEKTCPSVKTLENIARSILMQAMQNGSESYVTQGPLMAEARHYDTPAVVTATLSLVPMFSSGVYIDARVIVAKKQRKFVPPSKEKR